MQVIKIDGALCMYQDNNVPSKFIGKTLFVPQMPEMPDDGNNYHLDIVGDSLVWVINEPVEPEVPTMEERITALEEENKALKEQISSIQSDVEVWNEMDSAYQEGVNSAYDQ